MKVNVMTDILKANDLLAGDIRELLKKKGISSWNLMGAPGSGKTSILERLIPMLQKSVKVGVVEGDLATTNDAERIAKAGAQSVQINTNGGCHLDAAMVRSALGRLDLDSLGLIFIENVGNLVCPASYNLGETGRVIVSSVAEGDDKPEKYPVIFRNVVLVLLNKFDLIEKTNFSREKFAKGLKKINPSAEMLLVSATSGAGFEKLLAWFLKRLG